MGVVLTPIIPAAADRAARTCARRCSRLDGNGELYQFLALIRLRDGTPLRDASGRTTSYLSGLFFRTTRLLAEHGSEAGVRLRRRAVYFFFFFFFFFFF